MNNVLPYLMLYYTFIDCQSNAFIVKEKMRGFWVKSKWLFYLRLVMVNLRHYWVLPTGATVLIIIGIVVAGLDPSVLLVLYIMYISNCMLQHSRMYGYIKYILYLIPLVFLMWDYVLGVYMSIGFIALINLFCLFTFKFNVYEREAFQLDIFDFKNKEALIAFGGLFGFIICMLLVISYMGDLHVEEVMTLVLIVLVTVLKVDISNNKLLMIKVRSRFDLIRSKSDTISFKFLMPKQKYQIYAVLTCSFVAAVILGIIRQSYLTQAILFVGCVMFFLYIVDYITQHILLEHSIVYDNRVVKELLEGLLSMMLFVYVVTFMANKYVTDMNFQSNNTSEAFFTIFGNAQIGYAFVYFGLIVFFGYRLHKTFAINRLSSVKVQQRQQVKKTG